MIDPRPLHGKICSYPKAVNKIDFVVREIFDLGIVIKCHIQNTECILKGSKNKFFSAIIGPKVS